MSETIIVAIISLVGTLFGSYLAQRKTTALVVYRTLKVKGSGNLWYRRVPGSISMANAEWVKIG